jgi:hypothetical protein
MARIIKTVEAFSQDEIGEKVWKVHSARNVEFIDGTAKTGVGVSTLLTQSGKQVALTNVAGLDSVFTLQEFVNGVYKERYALVTVQGDLCVWNDALEEFDQLRIFGGRMKAVGVTSATDNGEVQDVMLAGKGGVVFMRGLYTAVEHSSPVLPTACFALGRYFFVEKPYTLWYSKPYAPCDHEDSINDGGNVRLPSEYGTIVGVAAVNEYVYVFYEYGISRIKVGGSAREFRVYPLAYGGGKIHGDSLGVSAIGERQIVFLAEDGLYSLRGESVNRICKELAIKPFHGKCDCYHAEFDGKYFLSYTSEDGTRKAVVADMATGKGYFAFEPFGLSGFAGRAYCDDAGYLKNISIDGDLPRGETYTFETENVVMGKTRKTLDFIELFGEGECSVLVRSDMGEWKGDFHIKDGKASHSLALRGKNFVFTFTLQKGCVLRGLRTEFQAPDGKGV